MGPCDEGCAELVEKIGWKVENIANSFSWRWNSEYGIIFFVLNQDEFDALLLKHGHKVEEKSEDDSAGAASGSEENKKATL